MDSLTYDEWINGASPIDAEQYWTDLDLGNKRIGQSDNDLLKVYGLSVSGGLIRSVCKAKESSAIVLHTIMQNSTLTRCKKKNAAGSFFLCIEPCDECHAPSTNHLDGHFLTTRASNQAMFGAVKEYDVACNGRGHSYETLELALVGSGYQFDWDADERVGDVKIKHFAKAGFGPLDRDLTFSAGADARHYNDDATVIKPSLIDFWMVSPVQFSSSKNQGDNKRYSFIKLFTISTTTINANLGDVWEDPGLPKIAWQLPGEVHTPRTKGQLQGEPGWPTQCRAKS